MYCGPASVARSDALLTGNQEVAGSILTGSGNILSWSGDQEVSG